MFGLGRKKITIEVDAGDTVSVRTKEQPPSRLEEFRSRRDEARGHWLRRVDEAVAALDLPANPYRIVPTNGAYQVQKWEIVRPWDPEESCAYSPAFMIWARDPNYNPYQIEIEAYEGDVTAAVSWVAFGAGNPFLTFEDAELWLAKWCLNQETVAYAETGGRA